MSKIGYFSIRGINVTYWIYAAVASGDNAFDSDGNDGAKDNSNRNIKVDIPIIMIHGGPGATHNYMVPLKQQACRGRTVIFYDQAGCGDSHIVTNKNFTISQDYPWLLTAEYYAYEELPALIEHLQLDRFHIVANSWGTMVAQLYALDVAASTKKQHSQLISMVLSGPIPDAKTYIDAQWDKNDGTLGTLPPYMQRRIHDIDASNDYNSEEYRVVVQALTSLFVMRTYPPPDCCVKAATTFNEEIYLGMQGVSEYTYFTGTLKDFNVTGRLHELNSNNTLPILLMSSKYDTIRPSTIQTMHQQLELSEWIIFNQSGHVTMVDEPGPMNDAIGDFLDRVEYSMESNTKFLPLRKNYLSAVDASSCNNNGTITNHDNYSRSSNLAWFIIIGALIGYIMIPKFCHEKTKRSTVPYEAIPD